MNTKDYQLQQRNKKQLQNRIIEGVKAAARPPCLGLIPVLVLVAIMIFALANRDLAFDAALPTKFLKIFDYIKIAAIGTVFVVFLVALLTLLGKPYMFREAEAAALYTFKLEASSERCPQLVSSRLMKDGTRRWEFLSVYIPLDEWKDEKNIGVICHQLDTDLVGKVEHGGKNRHRIVFYTNKNAKSLRSDSQINESI